MHEIVKQTISEMFNADKKKAEEELNNFGLRGIQECDSK
jgi:hypothetical protein